MKRKTWLPLLVLVLTLLIFGVYRFYVRHITDNVAPKITIDESGGMLQISVRQPEEALLQGVTAQDARDGDVTASVIVESVGNINSLDQVTVVYAAFDQAGNVTKAQRTVQYTDYQPPRFSLSAPMAFPYGSHFNVLDYIGAQDQQDGDIRHRVKAILLDNAAITTEGIHDVHFRVTNSLGDTEELVIPVEVYPVDTYTAKLSLTNYLVYIPAGSTFNARSYLNTFTLSGETVSMAGNLPGDIRLEIDGTVDPQTPGVYPVSFRATKTVGTRTYTGYSKLIVVVEG